MKQLEPYVPVLLSPFSVLLGARGVPETALLAVTSALLVVYVTCRHRHGKSEFLQHVLHVTGAAYLVIALILLHDEYEVSPMETLSHDFLFVLWCWLSALPLLLKRSGSLSPTGPPFSSSSSRYRGLRTAAIFVQVLLALSASGILLTSACTPTMHLDWLLFPSDCSRVYQNRKPAIQFVTSVLCLLYAGALLPVWLRNLLSPPSIPFLAEELRAVHAYFKFRGGNFRRHLVLALTLLLPVCYYCVFDMPTGCHGIVREVVSPEALPRLNPPSRDPYCQPRFETLEVPMHHVDTWTEAEKLTLTQGGRATLRGGAWEPSNCRPWQRVAIIVPYRDRERQLLQLLATLHPFLQRQLVSYRIFVVEQAGRGVFNRGKVKDAGFLEAERRGPFHCYIFHDVDMLPERQDNLYLCDGSRPRHLCPALDEMRYRLAYNNLLGGVVAMTGSQFRQVNGFPTLYWGWGAEDDDLSARILETGMIKTQPPNHVGRYKMLRHVKDTHNPLASPLLWKWRNRWRQDGLSNPELMRYSLVSEKELALYTHLLVEVGQPPLSMETWLQGTPVPFHWWRRFWKC